MHICKAVVATVCLPRSRLKLVSAMLRDAAPRPEDEPELRRALLDSLKELERQQAAHAQHPVPPAPHPESHPAPQPAPRPPQHAQAPARPSGAAEPRRPPAAVAAEAAERRSGSAAAAAAAAQELPARAPARPSAPPLPREAPSAPPMPTGGPGPSRAGDPSPLECQIVRDPARVHALERERETLARPTGLLCSQSKQRKMRWSWGRQQVANMQNSMTHSVSEACN